MTQELVSRYRIFCPESEIDGLPSTITVEERYPAFVVVSALEGTIEEVQKHYPVERLPVPKAPPEIPPVADLASTMAEPKKRGPYTLVARFRAPVRREWLEELEKTGCESRGGIGNSTLVVNCPNKTSLNKLQKLPTLDRVSAFVPSVRISSDFFDRLGVQADEAAIAEAAENLASAGAERRPGSDLPLPGILSANFFTEEDRNSARRRLQRQGIHEIIEAGETSLIIDLTRSKDAIQAVQTIASLPGLRSLEEKKLKRTFNDVARLVIADRVITPNPDSLGLMGRGEIVAVADSGLDTGNLTTIHPDFRGRVRDIQSFPIVSFWSPRLNNPQGDDGPADRSSGHGTHVCGSILGNGARAMALGLAPIQGVAPEAELVFQAIEQTMDWNLQGRFFWLFQVRRQPPPSGLFGIPDDLRELFQPAYAQGARIHSNSWGGGQPGEYDEQCQELDQFVWENKDFLVLVAAGNDGRDINPPGSGIDLTSVTSPGTAKNCLTVGACENDRAGQFTTDTYGRWWPGDFPNEPFKSDAMTDAVDDIVAFSSRGPCRTGRRKPDLIAPGTFVLSTRSSQIPSNHFAWGAFPLAKQDYMYMGGTSMATPLSAGCAAVVRQYLRETKSINSPSAALVKAILIHSAQYRRYRFAHPGSSAWADNEQGWGRVDLQQVLHPDPPTQVLFFDEGSGLHTGELRQLDIEITDSPSPLRATLVYSDFPGEDLVNNLNLFAVSSSGKFFVGNDFAGMAVPDADNNVEGIVIENPETGTWSIRVVASNIPEGPQDFALVISGGGARILSP